MLSLTLTGHSMAGLVCQSGSSLPSSAGLTLGKVVLISDTYLWYYEMSHASVLECHNHGVKMQCKEGRVWSILDCQLYQTVNFITCTLFRGYIKNEIPNMFVSFYEKQIILLDTWSLVQ